LYDRNIGDKSAGGEKGEFCDWLVTEGDSIAKGDPVAVVMTDKVEMEVESEVAGRLTRGTAREGDVIAVGEAIGYVESAEDDGLGDLDELLA
jgi:pyruvate/2-oxoglutarate dehydrogenase complex dihydrolipoamide acyltransferase (E2) component